MKTSSGDFRESNWENRYETWLEILLISTLAALDHRNSDTRKLAFLSRQVWIETLPWSVLSVTVGLNEKVAKHSTQVLKHCILYIRRIYEQHRKCMGNYLSFHWKPLITLYFYGTVIIMHSLCKIRYTILS